MSEKDQKRKSKLAARTKRDADRKVTPYEGAKYQSEAWGDYVYPTELAIYEVLKASGGRLANPDVKAALVGLVQYLRAGGTPTLTTDDLAASLPKTAAAFVALNIRRRWTAVFAELKPVPVEDLIGILRTLLHSMEAQAWALGASRGYLHFLQNFMRSAHGEAGGDEWLNIYGDGFRRVMGIVGDGM